MLSPWTEGKGMGNYVKTRKGTVRGKINFPKHVVKLSALDYERDNNKHTLSSHDLRALALGIDDHRAHDLNLGMTLAGMVSVVKPNRPQGQERPSQREK